MNRYKTLFTNTLIFAISNFASKLLSFFMLPLYTSVLTSKDFGKSEVITSTVSLLLPILTLSISSATLRFAINDKEDKKQVFSFGIKIILGGFIILLLSFPVLIRIDIINKYIWLFYLIYLSSALNLFFIEFIRGINKIKLIGIVGVLQTIITIVFNIVMLVIFHLGIIGYFISIIFSNTVCIIILFLAGNLYKYITIKTIEKRLKKEMLFYSVPLAPNSLSWWINDTANRYIITAFCGVSQVGLFGVATRIPTILVTLQGIFYQAWQLSAINEYGAEDKDEFFSKVYRQYNLFMIFCCSILICFTKVIAKILFTGEFYSAWKYVPLLLVSVIFGALSGFIGSLYSASKETKMLFITTLAGAIVSVGINLLLVPFIGGMGAALANLLSYVAVWLARYIDSRRYVKFKVNILKDVLCYILIIIQAIIVIYAWTIVGYISSFIVFCIILFLNLNELTNMYIAGVSIVKLKLKL